MIGVLCLAEQLKLIVHTLDLVLQHGLLEILFYLSSRCMLNINITVFLKNRLAKVVTVPLHIIIKDLNCR